MDHSCFESRIGENQLLGTCSGISADVRKSCDRLSINCRMWQYLSTDHLSLGPHSIYSRAKLTSGDQPLLGSSYDRVCFKYSLCKDELKGALYEPRLDFQDEVKPQLLLWWGKIRGRPGCLVVFSVLFRTLSLSLLWWRRF